MGTGTTDSLLTNQRTCPYEPLSYQAFFLFYFCIINKYILICKIFMDFLADFIYTLYFCS